MEQKARHKKYNDFIRYSEACHFGRAGRRRYSKGSECFVTLVLKGRASAHIKAVIF
jgi:hypothetical protein